jgi:hypothetical protein
MPVTTCRACGEAARRLEDALLPLPRARSSGMSSRCLSPDSFRSVPSGYSFANSDECCFPPGTRIHDFLRGPVLLLSVRAGCYCVRCQLFGPLAVGVAPAADLICQFLGWPCTGCLCPDSGSECEELCGRLRPFLRDSVPDVD